MSNSVTDFAVYNAKGESVSLQKYAGQVLLIVNVASRCGFTPQYKELAEIYEKYKNKGLVVLGFPCNQFLSQEPGTNEEIHGFCTQIYGVTFPIFAKVNVNGSDTDPFYTYLKKQAPGFLFTKTIKWNFTKFLVGRDGKVVKRFAPIVSPLKIQDSIEALLEKK